MGIGLAVFIMHCINESLPSFVHMLSETTMAFIKDRLEIALLQLIEIFNFKTSEFFCEQIKKTREN